MAKEDKANHYPKAPLISYAISHKNPLRTINSPTVNPTIAQKAGYIYTELESEGNTIGLRDSFIAAMVLTRKCNVATRNTVHFKKVKGLTVITA